MKKSDIYEIAIKILGLYLFFTCTALLREVLTYILSMVNNSLQPNTNGGFNETPFFILALVNLVFVVWFASFLTFRTKTIVRLVCISEDYEETSTLFADRKVIYEIALVLMGLLLIIWTLPDFVFQLKNYYSMVQFNVDNKNYIKSFILTSAIKIIVGLIAIIYAKAIAKIIVRDHKTTN